jgi:Cys-tRNA(Pro)/Cys-tRNA(Cys) deacylase
MKCRRGTLLLHSLFDLKTNAIRELDKLNVAYSLREYKIDLDDLGAVKVANQIGLPPDQVFKTLCAKANEGEIVFALVAADAKLDLKALARLAGKRTMELVPVSQLKQLTGYVRGGVTALAAKRRYSVYLDDSAEVCRGRPLDPIAATDSALLINR